jgi:NADH:ubiquinone oxidoreductase subunit E
MPRKELPRADLPRGTMVGEAPRASSALEPELRAIVDRVLIEHPHHERPHLLPILQAVQSQTHWLSRPLLGYLSEQLAVPFSDLYGFATFYALLSTEPRPPVTIRVCKGVPCYLRGAAALGEKLEALLEATSQSNGHAPSVDWEWYPCLGQCEHAPALLVGERAVRSATPAMLEGIAREAGQWKPLAASLDAGTSDDLAKRRPNGSL